MESRKCVQCGKEFQISDSEIDFYNNKKYQLPKRCGECREKNNTQNRDHKNFTHQDPGNRNIPLKGTKARRISNTMSVLFLIVIFLIFGIFYVSYTIENDYSDYTAQQETYAGQQQEIIQESQVEDVTQIEDVTQAEDTRQIEETTQPIESSSSLPKYSFRNVDLLEEHFTKHGSEFGFETSLQYLDGANTVILSPNALTKKEAEDGDLIYYLETTNEIVFLSQNGFIRTYFKPDDGIEYFNRQ